MVPTYLDGSLVSPAYVVARPKSDRFPPSYIVSILKQKRYLRVIMNYSLSSARASLPFEELIRIKIPKPADDHLVRLRELEDELNDHSATKNRVAREIDDFAANALEPSC